MNTAAEAASTLVIVGSAFLGFTVLRVGWLVLGGSDHALEVWRRQWIEVSGLVVVGVVLVLIAVWIG